MQFDTKIAVVVRTDLGPWQKLNVASFLAGGIAAAFPACIGDAYEDGSGQISVADRPADPDLWRRTRCAVAALERALARNVTSALYTEDMFKTTHDAANREVVKAVARADLNLVGLAMRAERKVIDKIIDGAEIPQLATASRNKPPAPGESLPHADVRRGFELALEYD